MCPKCKSSVVTWLNWVNYCDDCGFSWSEIAVWHKDEVDLSFEHAHELINGGRQDGLQ